MQDYMESGWQGRIRAISMVLISFLVAVIPLTGSAVPNGDAADGDQFLTANRQCGGNDCNDREASVNPDRVEVCGDSMDNHCDGQVDEHCTAALPARLAAAGDSITQAFAASCSCNTNLFCLICLLHGDQPENSWFDGSNASVNSVLDRYLALDSRIGADKSAAADGSEMLGGSNSFSAQADQILAQVPLPDHVEVELGGNDICNRDCVDAANCNNPLYTDAEWTSAVRAGLDKLVAGLPLGSTIYLLSVPRVQDLRQAGLDKQAAASHVDCEGAWSDFDICRIGTQATVLNGESLSQRLAGIAARQQRYNEILRDEAIAYNRNADGQNPRGIEVVSEYIDDMTLSIGTLVFGANDIDGGDCFHPSIPGQHILSETFWQQNPDQ